MAKQTRSGTSAGTNHNTPKADTKEAVLVHAGKGQLVNTLARWHSEAASAGSQILPLIRLDENEKLVIPFTTSGTRINLHFLDSAVLRGYVHCLGDSCLLCKVGKATETRDLLPAYDIVERTVGVLAVSLNMRPNALLPQWLPILQRVEAGMELFLATIRKLGNTNFVVTTLPLPEGSDDGATMIARFREQMDSGEIDLSSAFQRLDNIVIQDIPEIATLMTMKRIARCGSDPLGQ